MVITETRLRQYINEAVKKALNEYRRKSGPGPNGYGDSTTARPGYGRMQGAIKNDHPTGVDYGNHSNGEHLVQPSIINPVGENFDAEKVVLQPKDYFLYKIVLFGEGRTTNKSTLESLFGGDTKKFVNALYVVNGCAKRNGTEYPLYRTVGSSLNKSYEKNGTHNTYFEYSLDGGSKWFLLKPNPVNEPIESPLDSIMNNPQKYEHLLAGTKFV